MPEGSQISSVFLVLSLAVAPFYSPECLGLNIKVYGQPRHQQNGKDRCTPESITYETGGKSRAGAAEIKASLPPELEPRKGHLWAAASNMKTEEARLIPPDPSSSEL